MAFMGSVTIIIKKEKLFIHKQMHTYIYIMYIMFVGQLLNGCGCQGGEKKAVESNQHLSQRDFVYVCVYSRKKWDEIDIVVTQNWFNN